MRDIALFRLTMTSKTLALEQCEFWFLIALQSMLQTRTEDIKGQNAKTDQDIMNHSVLKSTALTHGCSSLLTRNGLDHLHFSWMNSICDLAAIKQRL